MASITEFLEARIAEDEALATAASKSMHGAVHDDQWDWASYVLSAERDSTEKQDDFITTWWPNRVLAECAAKRAIAGLHKEGADQCDEHNALFESIACPTLRAVAAVYAGHPDYQQEWA